MRSIAGKAVAKMNVVSVTMEERKTMTITRSITTLGLAGLLIGTAWGATACKEAQAKVKGVGDNLKAFIVKNCATGDRYCQVCAYSGKPTVMAVGDINDAEFEKDLAQIQSLMKQYEGKGLSAFALFGKFEGGKFLPVDDDASLKKVKALQDKLDLSFPVALVPKQLTDKEKKNYTPFADAYEVSKSRTVMVGAVDNKIVFTDVMKGQEAQYKALKDAVSKTL